MKHLRAMAAVGAVCAVLAGCGGDGSSADDSDASAAPDASEGLDLDTLRVGNSPVYPPMSFLPEGDEDPANRQGFDVDLATAIADELGVGITFEQQAYEQYLPSLSTGRLDLVHSAMQDLPDRRETVDFVDYYLTGPQLFTTSDRTDLGTLADLCGGSVVLDTGDVGYRDALTAAADEACQGADPIEVVAASGTADALIQLDQGRADATIRGAESVAYLMNEQEPGRYATVDEPLSQIPVGIAVAKDNPELRDAVADALATLVENGTYAEIGERWNLSDLLLDAVTVNGEPVG
ncbi:transporter substrate-binding domain-containing protein [Streptomyces radicis]|uniref:ABC transporter substrate-binding protein n=1 Tax=Streptomyces radicis TaxID=1750517 RepID=A0A3A9WXE4_9ACTN|nr:transporter substrate-binding domain-containing protein [Streptomyces radicis]RKN12486.1 ABC transporter substrate-binding protein [Streptomyces radicis]RKN27746.1 ABC transporter substrate-binding protein [Streptomyces radicis]